MEAATPSRTALGVALRRAVHQLADAQPHILADPIATPILLPTYRAALDKAIAGKNDPGSRMLRTWLVARSRYAEDNLALAVSRGIRQYVLLGAGLDTFAHRNPHTGLRVFEVDHPATQHWKRGLLSEHNIAHPDALTYVPVDFESQSLTDELHAAGFDSTQPTLFAWLGVTMYLTMPAFRGTLAFIAAQPAGSSVVFDYATPAVGLSMMERAGRAMLAARVSRAGEPFQLFLSQEEMRAELAGFGAIEDLDADALNARYFDNRTDNLRLHGKSAHMVCATR